MLEESRGWGEEEETDSLSEDEQAVEMDEGGGSNLVKHEKRKRRKSEKVHIHRKF